MDDISKQIKSMRNLHFFRILLCRIERLQKEKMLKKINNIILDPL